MVGWPSGIPLSDEPGLLSRAPPSSSRPAARRARRSRYSAARISSIATTGAVISTKAPISSSWITSRDWAAVKYTIDATRMQPAPNETAIAGPWMRW